MCLQSSAQATAATGIFLDAFSRDFTLHSVTSGCDLTLAVGLINESAYLETKLGVSVVKPMVLCLVKLHSRVIDFMCIDKKNNAARFILTGCHKFKNGGNKM